MAEYIDYDYKPESSGGGKFLNLANKGDMAVIRLADKPITYFVHWVDNKTFSCPGQEECDTCKRIEALPVQEQKKQEITKQKRRQTFIWPVIDRSDGEAKVYKAGINVFLEIANYAKNPKWGGDAKDATLFDLEITRTEASLQNFYSVIADPTSLGKPLTAEEKAEVEKLRPLIDSVAIMAGESQEAEHNAPETVAPSQENPSSPDDFIKGLEEDRKAEQSAS